MRSGRKRNELKKVGDEAKECEKESRRMGFFWGEVVSCVGLDHMTSTREINQ